MTNTSYLLIGTVTDSNSAAISGGTVVARDTNLDQSTTAVTNSSGQYVIDLANLTSQWTAGDTVVVSIDWGNEDAEEVVVLATSPTTQNLQTAVKTVSTGTPTYCSVQDVYDELDGKTSTDISTTRVTNAILRAEALIDRRTGTSWKINTVTNETHSFHRYNAWGTVEEGLRSDISSTTFDTVRLNHYPIVSITSLSKNGAGTGSADSWTALTEQSGSGGDYEVNYDTGDVTFIKSFPRQGLRAWKASYTYGASTVPADVERLAILLAVRQVLTTKSSGALFDNTSNIRIGEISLTLGASSVSSYLRDLQSEMDDLWEQLGTTTAVEVF